MRAKPLIFLTSRSHFSRLYNILNIKKKKKIYLTKLEIEEHKISDFMIIEVRHIFGHRTKILASNSLLCSLAYARIY